MWSGEKIIIIDCSCIYEAILSEKKNRKTVPLWTLSNSVERESPTKKKKKNIHIFILSKVQANCAKFIQQSEMNWFLVYRWHTIIKVLKKYRLPTKRLIIIQNQLWFEICKRGVFNVNYVHSNTITQTNNPSTQTKTKNSYEIVSIKYNSIGHTT